MEITREQRLEQYKNSSELVRNIYSSPDTGELLARIASANNISDYRTFTLLVGDVVLGLSKQSELLAVLSTKLNIPTEQAALIVMNLSGLLSKLPTTQTTSNYSTTFASEQAQGSQTPPTPDHISPAPTTQSHQPESVQDPETPLAVTLERVRTMGADAERVHGYGAYRQVQQPEVDSASQPTSRPRDPLASLPRYMSDEEKQ